MRYDTVIRQPFPWEFYWSPFGPYDRITWAMLESITSRSYDPHIMLANVPPKKIHLVLGIPNFLDFFD